jgi:hypothetical protein
LDNTNATTERQGNWRFAGSVNSIPAISQESATRSGLYHAALARYVAWYRTEWTHTLIGGTSHMSTQISDDLRSVELFVADLIKKGREIEGWLDHPQYRRGYLDAMKVIRSKINKIKEVGL